MYPFGLCSSLFLFLFFIYSHDLKYSYTPVKLTINATVHEQLKLDVSLTHLFRQVGKHRWCDIILSRKSLKVICGVMAAIVVLMVTNHQPRCRLIVKGWHTTVLL